MVCYDGTAIVFSSKISGNQQFDDLYSRSNYFTGEF